ncbi:hypothetical protein [Flavobacterium daemonense]|uniref:hypothetical protein n=1 Tax=Flavobacterium daemonense TaxID=1393049 RepID=UPI0011868326|nr:hypothetical protein [Flavobacterium daemonense]KAF2332472.1 hypothetical protein FND99_11820 [Flavobacterium daemonense]
MKKKIFIVLIVLVLLFSTYYYWQNRYVVVKPIIAMEYDRQIILFDNSYFRFAEPSEISPNFYKHIKFVLSRSAIDYVEENGIIYVRNKFFNDMELAWNYTNRANSVEYFKMEREVDSINLIYEKEYVDSQKKIIDGYLKEIKATSKNNFYYYRF